ncbi:aminotransferase class V-fold PLP-dependent enzyme [Candidatus Desantisbacteria bacterium]|nr:aminotransferase class V-fold PLP-dependent enzyme [Candidatus Desantisbacteria bacterium]
MGIDILASSLHKNFGPSGVGFLYIKKELMKNLNCFLVGGETVADTNYAIPQYAPLPYKFEAGLQNYAGIIGGGNAIDFIENIGTSKINEYKIQLNNILTEKLKTIPDLIILGPDSPLLRGGICNFIINGIDSFAIAKILSESNNIMLRAGYHCVHAWFHKNNISPSLRVSVQIYNTEEEILVFADAIKKISAYFK